MIVRSTNFTRLCRKKERTFYGSETFIFVANKITEKAIKGRRPVAFVAHKITENAIKGRRPDIFVANKITENAIKGRRPVTFVVATEFIHETPGAAHRNMVN